MKKTVLSAPADTKPLPLQSSPVEEVDTPDEPQKVTADLRRFNKAEDQVNKALAALSTIKDIQDVAGVTTAMDIMKKAKAVEKIIEDKRVSMVKPYNEEVKRINDYARNLTAKIPPAIQEGKNVLLAYEKAEQEKARKIRTEQRIQQLLNLGFVANEKGYINMGATITTFGIETYTPESWSHEIDLFQKFLEQKKQEEIDKLKNDLAAAAHFGEDDSEIKEQIKELEKAPAPAAPPAHVPSFGGGGGSIKGLTKTWSFEITDKGQVPAEYLMVDEVKVRAAIAAGARIIPGINIFQKEGISLR